MPDYLLLGVQVGAKQKYLLCLQGCVHVVFSPPVLNIMVEKISFIMNFEHIFEYCLVCFFSYNQQTIPGINHL